MFKVSGFIGQARCSQLNNRDNFMEDNVIHEGFTVRTELLTDVVLHD